MSNRYTTEEKVRAFDALWRDCGSGTPRLVKWQPLRPRVIDDFSYSQERVPVYEFTIAFVGHVDSFKDVLHALAIKKAPAGEDRGQGGQETTTKNEPSV